MLRHFNRQRLREQPQAKGMLDTLASGVGWAVDTFGSAVDSTLTSLGLNSGDRQAEATLVEMVYRVREAEDRFPFVESNVGSLRLRLAQLAADPSTGDPGAYGMVESYLADALEEADRFRQNAIDVRDSAFALPGGGNIAADATAVADRYSRLILG